MLSRSGPDPGPVASTHSLDAHWVERPSIPQQICSPRMGHEGPGQKGEDTVADNSGTPCLFVSPSHPQAWYWAVVPTYHFINPHDHPSSGYYHRLHSKDAYRG